MGIAIQYLLARGVTRGMCRTVNNGRFDTTFLTENDHVHVNAEGELISLHGEINTVEILDILRFGMPTI